MKKTYLRLIIAAGVLLFLLIIFGSSMFYIVQPGERGIIFRPFSTGLDTNKIVAPGFTVVAPWNEFIVYNVKESNSEEKMDVLDKNGLSISVDISVRFNPIPNKLPFLHQRFGENYINQLVAPETRSTVRQVMGRYTAEEIYSTKRAQVELDIINETTQKLMKKVQNSKGGMKNALKGLDINSLKNLK